MGYEGTKATSAPFLPKLRNERQSCNRLAFMYKSPQQQRQEENYFIQYLRQQVNVVWMPPAPDPSYMHIISRCDYPCAHLRIKN